MSVRQPCVVPATFCREFLVIGPLENTSRVFYNVLKHSLGPRVPCTQARGFPALFWASAAMSLPGCFDPLPTTVSRDGCPRIGRLSGSHTALHPPGLEQPLTLGTPTCGGRTEGHGRWAHGDSSASGLKAPTPRVTCPQDAEDEPGRSEPAPGCLWTEPTGRAAPVLRSWCFVSPVRGAPARGVQGKQCCNPDPEAPRGPPLRRPGRL